MQSESAAWGGHLGASVSLQESLKLLRRFVELTWLLENKSVLASFFLLSLPHLDSAEKTASDEEPSRSGWVVGCLH